MKTKFLALFTVLTVISLSAAELQNLPPELYQEIIANADTLADSAAVFSKLSQTSKQLKQQLEKALPGIVEQLAQKYRIGKEVVAFYLGDAAFEKMYPKMVKNSKQLSDILQTIVQTEPSPQKMAQLVERLLQKNAYFRSMQYISLADRSLAVTQGPTMYFDYAYKKDMFSQPNTQIDSDLKRFASLAEDSPQPLAQAYYNTSLFNMIIPRPGRRDFDFVLGGFISVGDGTYAVLLNNADYNTFAIRLLEVDADLNIIQPSVTDLVLDLPKLDMFGDLEDKDTKLVAFYENQKQSSYILLLTMPMTPSTRGLFLMTVPKGEQGRNYTIHTIKTKLEGNTAVRYINTPEDLKKW